MREYGKVAPSFWTGKTGKLIRDLGYEARIVATHLLTGPQTNWIGLYYLSLPSLAHETGCPIKGASKALLSLSSVGFAHYCEETEYVWIPEMARFQIAPSLAAGDKRIAGVVSDLLKVSNPSFVKAFTDKYVDSFSLKSAKKWAELERYIEGASEALRCPEPEPEPEPEQESEQTSLLPPASPSVSRTEQEFEEFWTVCERTDNRKGALKAWLAAKKAKTLPDPATVKLAYCALAASWDWTKENRQFHPQIATWLNREGWLEKPRSGGPPQSALKMIFGVKANRTPEEEARMTEGAEIPED